MTKPIFRVETSVDDGTGNLVAVVLAVGEGEVAETKEVEGGVVYADYDSNGSLIGIELLGSCDIAVLEGVTANEPEAVKHFLRGMPLRTGLSIEARTLTGEEPITCRTDEFQKERPNPKGAILIGCAFGDAAAVADDDRFRRPDQVGDLTPLVALCLGIFSLMLAVRMVDCDKCVRVSFGQRVSGL